MQTTTNANSTIQCTKYYVYLAQSSTFYGDKLLLALGEISCAILLH